MRHSGSPSAAVTLACLLASTLPLTHTHANIAPEGEGIIGVNPNPVYDDLGNPLAHAGSATAINDTNPGSRVDTWNGQSVGSSSYVGVLWAGPRSEKVKSLVLTLATFFDGGWFGVNGTGPGAGGALTAAHLAEPTVQITVDGGATWSEVAHTSNYIATMTGHNVGGGGFPNPTSRTSTFTLATPIDSIDGIRLIGRDGGQADVGFLGVFELEVITLPANDLDDDGMADDWEAANGLNPSLNDGALDADGDGLNNLAEFGAGLNPRAPDFDGDGLNDGPEVLTHFTDPKLPDTDGDGLSDGAEVATHGTNPKLVDTDTDGLADGAEVILYLTNPTQPDTDGDGYRDGLETRLGSNPAQAASRPADLAPLATAIFGVNDAVDGDAGTPHANAGATTHINDADVNSRVDTFGRPEPVSYVGLLWPTPVADPIARVELALAVFFDGGWFGPIASGPGTGSFLTDPEFLSEPTVQVTTDGGVTWTTVDHMSNYLSLFNGHPLPRANFGAPTSAEAVFELATPQAGINGIRLIGDNGGTADGSGFLGVFEMSAFPTLSSPPANMALAGSGLTGTNDAVDDDNGLRGANGTPVLLNDGLSTTRVDTFGVSDSDSLSYVGILWASPRTQAVSSVSVDLAVFFDGGWFGPNGSGSGAGSVLAASELVEPTVQITVDGITWESVPATSDYLAVMEGFALPAVQFGAPTAPSVTFVLTPPRIGLTGIRVIGENGGTADGNGFLGAFEIAVAASNPGGDTDGDGQSNGAEEQAGTNPNDPNDFLRLTSVTPATAAGGPVTLTWTSVPGKFYAVQQSNSLASGSWTWVLPSSMGAAPAPATTTSVTIDAPAATAGGKYYRIILSFPP